CNGEDFNLIAEQDKFGFHVSTVLCKNCGLLQTNPCLREKDYIDFYQNHYRKLYAGTLALPEEYFTNKLSFGRKQFNWIVKHLDLEKQSLVLEVGSGAGATLYNFCKNGYKTLGIDYDRECLEAGKTRYGKDSLWNVYEGDLHSITLEEKPKLIIYSHVLEHIFDINRELTKVAEILSEDGYLFIEVPGVKNVKTWYSGNFLGYLENAHLYHFTLRTLTNIMHKHGFVLVDGDEYIRAIYRKSNTNQEIVSDFENANNFVEDCERSRFILSVKKQLKFLVKKLGLMK
ncbi:class I SAM-dependent methyltransferase, partial [Limnofasciculus baicalensis]